MYYDYQLAFRGRQVPQRRRDSAVILRKTIPVIAWIVIKGIQEWQICSSRNGTLQEP